VPEQKKLAVAETVLVGEIQYREGLYVESFASLRRGIELDDNLPFDEPWGWMVPVRHALAALMAERGRLTSSLTMVRDAANICREDLRLHPRNIWSLVCLRDCLAEIRTASVDGEGEEEFERVCGLIEAVSKETGVAPPGASCACAVERWKCPVAEERKEEEKMSKGLGTTGGGRRKAKCCASR
jgi:hypothetical protein